MKKNNILFISINIIIVIVIILLIMWMFNTKETKDKKMKQHSVQCNKKGCPIPKLENSIYQIYHDFEDIRNKNNKLNSSFDIFNTPHGGPKNIFIIRHGEKNQNSLSKGLDCNGILRSSYIPLLVKDLNDKGYGINSFVSAYDYWHMHQEQTVMFASWALTIPLYLYGTQNNTDEMIIEIFTNKNYKGKNIIICLEHSCIQKLVKTIITYGSQAKQLQNYKFINEKGNSDLPYWGKNNFDSVFHFDDNLNFKVHKENISTCYKKDNNEITYGKEQQCSWNIKIVE